ncbi:MAG: CBS domain-containing protein [SAR324 cluster bacterium]|nr:CBS domain-containing protein [SAR324 cluster bacterium]
MNKIPIVADFMDREFTKFSPDMPMKEALNILIKKKLLAALVVDKNGKLIGIFSEKDFLKILLHKAYNQRPWGLVKDQMHEAPDAIPSTMPTTEAAEILVAHKSRRLPVVDNGKLVGQITRRDLLRGMHLELFGKKS